MQSQDPEHDLDALAAMVEGRLDDRARARLTEHLAVCAECRATLAALTRAHSDGALAPASRPASRRPWRGVPIWAGLAASALVATFAWMQFARPPATGEELLVRRGAERIVAGKTFHLESDTWVDSAFDADGNLPTTVVRGADERGLLLLRIPELGEFADLGSRVVVVWQGTVYRFEP